MKLRINESQLKKIVDFISENIDDEKLNVLFVGDSLSTSDGWTWNHLLEKDFPNWNVKHLTKGGERTSWMLNQLENELKNKKYDLVFIYGGTNDMFSQINVGGAINNIQRMVNLVNQQGGQTYVFSGYDAKSVMSDDKLQPTKYCDKKCMLKSRDKMIEFQSQLSGLSNAKVIPVVQGYSTWTQDGIHPSASKHIDMKNHVKGYLGTMPQPTQATKKLSFFEKLFGSKKQGRDSNFDGTDLLDKLIDDLENIKSSSKSFEFKGQIIVDDDVKVIQTALELLNHYLPVWGIDGKFGNETKTAVKELQNELGLKETGIVDDELISEIIDGLKSNNITNKDFEKIQIEKTQSLPDSEETEYDSSSNISNRFEREAMKKYGVEFVDRVKEISNNVGLKDYNILLAIMYFESGLNPSAQNPYSRATGLIQFMPKTAQSLGISIGALKSMSALEQLDYVEKFFENKQGLVSKVSSPEEAYLLVFYPAAVGKSDDYILGKNEKIQQIIAKQNKGFDLNRDNKITKGEILTHIKNKWGNRSLT
jgi:peptidoglycan hydrolase-like protein with peptidoglycan-binding domain